MGTLIFVIVCELAALGLWVARQRKAASLALAASGLPMLGLYIYRALHGRYPLENFDHALFAAEIAVVGLAFVSFWRVPRTAFWLGWAINSLFLATLAYVAFFWHPFG